MKRYTITLGCGAVEVMNKFFEEIRLVMGDSKSVEVREIFLIPLGDMGFLQIKPDHKFLRIHQFYNPGGNQAGKPTPGIPGVSLKIGRNFQS